MVCAPSKDARPLASKVAYEVQTKGEEEKARRNPAALGTPISCDLQGLDNWPSDCQDHKK